MSASGAGAFLAVVGASGAGKDSVMREAELRLRAEPRVSFVRRVVTRPCDPSAEDHETMTPEAFRAAERAGAFALSWASHGLFYGVPASVDAIIAAGGVAVANLSRAAVGDAEARYWRVVVAEIVADPEIRAARLAGRGRETDAGIAGRLSRKVEAGDRAGWVAIENNGPLEEAGEALARLIRDALSAGGSARPPGTSG